VTYIFKIRLAGRLPNSVVSYATTETPLCTGRARDAFYEREFSLPSLSFIVQVADSFSRLQMVTHLMSRTLLETLPSSSRTNTSTPQLDDINAF